MHFYIRISILFVCGLMLIEPFRLRAQQQEQRDTTAGLDSNYDDDMAYDGGGEDDTGGGGGGGAGGSLGGVITVISSNDSNSSRAPSLASSPLPPTTATSSRQILQSSSSSSSNVVELNTELVAPSEAFAKSLVLIQPNVFIIYWSHNTSHIRMEVHVKTNGWFSLGFKPRSLVDYYVASVSDDGTAHFSDRHRWSTTPVMNASQLDERQDAQPLYAAKSNGFTVVKFERTILSCADEQTGGNLEDVDLNDPVTLVYAHGPMSQGEIVYYEMQSGQTNDVRLVDLDKSQLESRVRAILK